MKTYCVEYSAQGWQPRSRHQMLPHQPVEEYQVVERDLTDDEHLYVELARAPGGPPHVVIARITSPVRQAQRKRVSRPPRFLRADELDLVEVP